MKKSAFAFFVVPRSGLCIASMGLMALSALLRMFYFMEYPMGGLDCWFYEYLPQTAATVYIVLLATRAQRPLTPLLAPVAMDVAFFIYKALSFASLTHTILCCILYLSVIVLFALTLAGVIRTRLILVLLAGLPLLVHLIMDLVEVAEAGALGWSFLPEASVLCIMGALLCFSLALRRNER